MRVSASAIFLFILHIGSAQSISYETISILNSNYVASDSWEGVPLDIKGEDVNNLVLGGNYYPPISVSSQKPDKRTTLARGFMQVEIQFENKSENQYLLEKVILVIDQTYPYKAEYESLEWEIGTRGGDYNPYFEMEEGVFRYEDLPEDYVLMPKDQPQDVRVTLDIDCFGDKEIRQFHVEAVFTNVSSAERLKVRSDRDYFIASE